MFIALELPLGLKEELLLLQERLRSKISGVRWVRTEGIHLTLKFFGDIERGQLEAIEEVLRRTAPSEVFSLFLTGLGVFPNHRMPRVLWVGIQEEEGKELVDFQKRLEEGLEGICFPREGRAFSPHLTLGRVVSRQGLPGVDQILREKVSQDRFRVEEVNLMRSELKPTGSLYTKWFTLRLGSERT